MSQDPRLQFRTIQLSGWRGVAALVAGAGLIVAILALLALSFVFIALPALIIGSVLYYFRPRKPRPPMAPRARPAGPGAVIEGTYEVAEPQGRQD